MLRAAQEFTGLVRSGAYIAGSRAVRPKERSQWRFTFRRILAESRAAPAAPDPAGGEAALTEMIDLACQLRDWESRFGWTRSGWGTISERESTLTDVVAGLLTVPDTWVTFTEHYLRVLDGLTPPPPPPASGRRRSSEVEQRRRGLDRRGDRRADVMIDWHLTLLDRLAGTEDAALLDRIADHAALGGPEQTYFTARLAQVRGDLPAARAVAASRRLSGS